MKVTSWDDVTGITWEYLHHNIKFQRKDWWVVLKALLRDSVVPLKYKVLSAPEGAVAPPSSITYLKIEPLVEE